MWVSISFLLLLLLLLLCDQKVAEGADKDQKVLMLFLIQETHTILRVCHAIILTTDDQKCSYCASVEVTYENPFEHYAQH